MQVLVELRRHRRRCQHPGLPLDVGLPVLVDLEQRNHRRGLGAFDGDFVAEPDQHCRSPSIVVEKQFWSNVAGWPWFPGPSKRRAAPFHVSAWTLRLRRFPRHLPGLQGKSCLLAENSPPSCSTWTARSSIPSPSAERVWSDWARRHGLDVAAFLPTIHGVRASRPIAPPGASRRRPGARGRPAAAGRDRRCGWHRRDRRRRGVPRLAAGGRWAIVTSAPRALALAPHRRLPAFLSPRSSLRRRTFRAASRRPTASCLAQNGSALDARDCLVFEDAPGRHRGGRGRALRSW